LRELVLEFLGLADYKAMTIEELVEHFQIEEATGFKDFVKLMVGLEEEGLVARTRSDRYTLSSALGLLKGIISIHPKGFGFVEVAGKDDVYVKDTDLHGALQKDTVLIKTVPSSKGGGSVEGVVVQVLERGISEFIGTYYENKQVGYVRPDNTRYLATVVIPKHKSKGAVKDHKVLVKVVDYLEDKTVKGEIAEILGHKNDPGIDIMSVIYKYDIVPEFAKDAMAQAESIPETIEPESYKGRTDLRGETIVTIDGDDAKDLDDAVHVKLLDNGNYLLGVSIADVSYYVTEGSPLDREAYFKGTSVYLVDRVIPMIPHRLSNGICSLNPKVDRLVITCEMEITPQGEVVASEIFPAVINTTERMTYDHVNKILQGDAETRERYKDLVPTFELMLKLSETLRGERHERGGIDFDLEESKVVVDEYGFPIDVILRERDVAEKLIEDFMLCANETVAEKFHFSDLPFIYRVHEHPKPEKLERFYRLARALGYEIKGTKDKVHPKALQMVTEAVHGKPEHAAISTMMLRSLQKARYSEESLGHFGLAAEYYTHFTSPIRRYPDLMVHRLIRKYLFEKDTSPETVEYYRGIMPEVGLQTSKRERDAIDAEREVEDMKKAEYMTQFIGEEYEGIISSVTKWGIYVELPNTIEGLVHVNELTDDFYDYDEDNLALIGRRNKVMFKIGDTVKVVVAAANKEERTIDFQLVGMTRPRRRENFRRIDTREAGKDKKDQGRSSNYKKNYKPKPGSKNPKPSEKSAQGADAKKGGNSKYKKKKKPSNQPGRRPKTHGKA